MRVQQGFMSPRSIAVLVILLVVLLVPLWWLRDSATSSATERAREISASQLSATTTVAVNTPLATSANAEVNDPNAYGMTWGALASDKLPAAAVWMSCHGSPKEGISQPHADNCNPYKGDASCRLALPVLCIKKDGSTPESAFSASAEPLKDERSRGALSFHDTITDGWAAGSVASTDPVAGFVLGSLDSANARCVKELGPGWRMASFHDGSGGGRAGWGFVAQRGARLDPRYRHWVYINDQPGNCWNNIK